MANGTLAKQTHVLTPEQQDKLLWIIVSGKRKPRDVHEEFEKETSLHVHENTIRYYMFDPRWQSAREAAKKKLDAEKEERAPLTRQTVRQIERHRLYEDTDNAEIRRKILKDIADDEGGGQAQAGPPIQINLAILQKLDDGKLAELEQRLDLLLGTGARGASCITVRGEGGEGTADE